MPDPSPTGESLGIQDLRAIIHGLRMSGFSYVGDENMRDKIGFMIEDLPNPEELTGMAESPIDLKHVSEHVGEIMKLVELGGARNEDFKVRYEAKKNMPPRYKVLKWRSAMNRSDLTKNLIKASMYADDKSEGLVAEQAIKLAKKVQDGSVEQEDLDSFSTSFEKAGLHKEAAMRDWWNDMKVAPFAGMQGGGFGFGQEMKNIGHGIVDPMKAGSALAKARAIMQSIEKNVEALKTALNNSYQWIQDPAFKQDVQGILQQVNSFQGNSNEVSGKLNEININYKRTKVPVGPDGQATSIPVGDGTAGQGAAGQGAAGQGAAGQGAAGVNPLEALPDPGTPIGDVTPIGDKGTGTGTSHRSTDPASTGEFGTPTGTPTSTPAETPTSTPSSPYTAKYDSMDKAQLQQEIKNELGNSIVLQELKDIGKTNLNELDDNQLRQMLKNNVTASRQKWVRIA